MKRILTLMLAAALTLSLTGCGGQAEENEDAHRSSAVAAPQSVTEGESIERKLIKLVSDNYSGTEVDTISVTENGDTADGGDYAVRALLNWDMESDPDQIRRTLTTYSADYANRVSKDCPNVSAFAVSWTVPGIDPDQASVGFSYERQGGALQETDSTISDQLGGAEAVERDRTEGDSAGGTSQTGGSDATPQQDREEALSAVLTAIEETLQNTYDTNYTLNHDETSITIGVWRDGVANGAVYAQQGDQECMSAWRTLVSAVRKMSSSMIESLRTAGLEDMQVIVSVVNDQNHDNVLLTVTDDKITYNWVEPDTQETT